MPKTGFFLAFDTSTDVMSIALTDGDRVWQHTGPGGAKASATLIPAILALLADAGLALGDLQAIAFGRGPGSFTGLRTACAVAQGLAFGADQGAGVAVLPIDTLMAVAEEARLHNPAAHITALLDARMDEMYVQRFTCHQGVLTKAGECQLIRPEHLVAEPGMLYAGNVFAVYQGRFPGGLPGGLSGGLPGDFLTGLPGGLSSVTCLPTASAMLRLAPRLAASGHCVAPAKALPLYVRDKVAQTTQEREQIKALKLPAV